MSGGPAEASSTGSTVSLQDVGDGETAVRLLDGRKRVAACALAGIEPRWESYDGDPVGFIIGINAERRHLTTGQRAMATAIGLAEAGLRRNGRFKRGSVPTDSSRSRSSGSAITR